MPPLQPPLAQALSQLPQCLPSIIVLTQTPSQSVVPGLQATAQVPALQVGVPPGMGPQACPQAPQLAGLSCRSTHSLPQRVPSPAQSTAHLPSRQT